MRTTKAKVPRLKARSTRTRSREAADLPARRTKTTPEFKKILVATDFSDFSKEAAQVAKVLAERFGASIRLVHIMEEAPFIAGVETIPLAIPDERLEISTTKKLEKLAATEFSPAISSAVEVRWGRAADEILNLARGRNIDLIVLGTHGHTGLKHLLLGSTAESVVRRAPCPVLVVPPTERRTSK